VKIADLFVDLHLDTGAFERELRTALASASSKDVHIKVDADTRKASREVQNLDRNVKKATSGINVFSGRLALMADALLALGPAAVGAVAVAIPALTAMGQAALATGGAVGTMVLAFHGVGDALKSISKARTDPSIANLQKMHDALKELSPEAREFAIKLSGMGDVIDELQASAGKELFSGLSDGLDAASDRLPDINDLLEEFGSILGDLGAQTGAALASDRWDVLFTFLKTTGRPTLQALADTTGNVAHGFIEILDAFAPLSTGGLDWMADVTGHFDDWATGLDKTEGFQDFVEYVRETGPQVADTLGALALAIVDIGKAAAPLSGPVLKAIEALAKGLSAVADSGVGPALITASIGMRLFSRASQALSGPISTVTAGFADIKKSVTPATTALGKFKTGIGGLVSGNRGLIGSGGLAVAATTSSEAVGILSGALGGAAIGSFAGPWGTAIGAVVGGIGGFLAASKNAQDELSEWDRLAGTAGVSYQKFEGLYTEANKAVVNGTSKASAAQKDLVKQADLSGDGLVDAGEAAAFYAGSGLSAAEAQKQFNSALADAGDPLSYVSEGMQENVKNFEGFQSSFSQLSSAFDLGPLDHVVDTGEEMDEVYRQLKPTLDALGVSQAEFNTRAADGSLAGTIDDVYAYIAATDSAEGKIRTLSDAFTMLDSEAVGAADSAAAFAAAVQSIFEPTIAAEEAAIAWREALRGINDESIKAKAGLFAHTAAADKNKSMILTAAKASIADAAARAKNGESARSLMKTMLQESNAIREQAKAQGLRGAAVDRYVDKVYNVPALISTVFQSRGIPKVEADARAMGLLFKKIPKQVRVAIAASGVKFTMGQLTTLNGIAAKVPRKKLISVLTDGVKLSKQQLKELATQAGLTPDEVKVLVKADTADAQKDTKNTQTGIDKLDRVTATPKITVNKSAFDSGMAAANATLNAFDTRSASSTITTNYVTTYRTVGSPSGGQGGGRTTGGVRSSAQGTGANIRNRFDRAGGGPVFGPGTATSDSIPALLSNGEFVIRAAAVDKYGSGLMSRINAMRFAGGGEATRKKRKEIFGTATLRDVANGLAKGFDASQIAKSLRQIVARDLSGRAERNQLRRLDRLNKLAAQQVAATKRVASARATLQTRREERGSFIESVRGQLSPDVSEFGSTRGGIAVGMRAKLTKVRQFIGNLQKLAKKTFIPKALLAQVAQLGPVDGNAAALQLLALSDSDLRALAGDFTALSSYATEQASMLGHAYYDAGIATAQANLAEMQRQQRHYNRVFENAADAFATQLAHRLNIRLRPRRRHHRATHDDGGWLNPGTTLATNNTGRPEAVLTGPQWTQMERLITAVERGGSSGGGGGAPLIGHAVIRETVDLRRYEQQRAFRNRVTRIGG
jgi:hypothetical protein